VHSSYPLCTLSLVISKLPARSEGNGRFVETLVLTAFHLQRQLHTPSPIHFDTCITLLHLPAYHKNISDVFSSFRSGLLPSCSGVDTLIKATEQLGTSTWIPQHLSTYMRHVIQAFESCFQALPGLETDCICADTSFVDVFCGGRAAMSLQICALHLRTLFAHCILLLHSIPVSSLCTFLSYPLPSCP
jgi:hypothetical protein